ncbi:MAG: hypothetical protein OXH85_03705 [Truepera sp.]|nr:hypothetical protein [Truepera sp.]
MRQLQVALATWLLLATTAAAQRLLVEADVAPSYRPGEEGLVAISVLLEDPGALVEKGVLFLNAIRYRDSEDYVQATHLLFATAEPDHDIFRRVLSGEALREGISTTISFRLRSRAQLGRYALVLQLFTGTNTDPHRLRQENRVGIAIFHFTLTEP